MEEGRKSFSSLKDQSKTPSSSPKPTLLRSQSTPASWGFSVLSNLTETPNVGVVADEFVDLSLEEGSLSSNAMFSYSSSSPSSCLSNLYDVQSETPNVGVVADEFVDLSLEESSLSSDAMFSYSSSSPSSCLSNLYDVQSEASFDQKEEIKNVETKKHLAFGKKKGLFPPPITCLKLFNKGMPYGYLNYKEETDSFVLEEIKIPHGDILRASRSGGRLRLTFMVSDDESSDIEVEEELMKEEEINGTVE